MKRDVGALAREAFDLIIIGGGITGAGVALDAASRGWRVALIDKGDFASGTSSASSKLIHGGLRYLEYGQLSLVHEALHERALLLRNAPHLVKPLPFALPFYQGQRMAPWKWRLGLTLYDLLAGRANIGRSRPCTVGILRRHAPHLRKEGLLGGAFFWDALTDDARFCLAVLQTAARHGAVLGNYVEAVGFEKHRQAILGVWARDRHAASEPFLIRGEIVLNATGPWGDAVARLAGDQGGPYLQPTKGTHVIVPNQHHQTAFLLLHPRDGRVFFVIPWQGKTLIGTTDTFPDAGPDALQVQAGEVAYLLEGYSRYFDPPLRDHDVMGAFAGLRPLLRERPGNPSSLSREFHLFISPEGLITAVGGKYTTYRAMAETIVDQIARRFGRSRPSPTQSIFLEGAPSEPWHAFFDNATATIQQKYPIGADVAANLVDRYGSRVYDVLAVISQTPRGFERLHPAEPDLLGEQTYQRDEEMALCPEDLFLRRSRIGMCGRGWIPKKNSGQAPG